jgi:homoserine dehydrogenase
MSNVAPAAAPRTVGVGMLGLGTVGSAVARRLIEHWELLHARSGDAAPVLRHVAVRDAGKQRDLDLKNVRLDGDALAVVEDPAVEIVVEVMGGIDPALSLIERALSLGKTVVTANKAVVAAHGPRLWSLGTAHGAGLWFEAAVGAGLPVVALLRDSMRGDRITSIDAVINGTTNMVLTRMREEGVTLDTALANAQRRGYAEADASADIDGWDAAQKLVIMAWLGAGVAVSLDDVDLAGIGALDRVDLGYTGQLGYAVRLLAHLEARAGGAVHLRVRPTAVPAGHPLFDVDDAANALLVAADLAGTVTLRGLGAGGDSTASAVVSDIINAVQHPGAQPVPPHAAPTFVLGPEDVDVSGYVRLRLTDTDEARQLTLQALADRGVPVVEALDKPPIDGPFPQLLVLTGMAPRAVHDRALETLDSLAVVREVACALDRIPPP